MREKIQAIKDRVKFARENAANGFLSQQDFASKLGVTRQSVGHWENAKRQEAPTIERLSQIAKLTGHNLDWLLVGDVATVEKGFKTPDVHCPMIPLSKTHDAEYIHSQWLADSDATRLTSPISCSVYSYCVTVIGQSMVSLNPRDDSFNNGSVIFCDPTIVDEHKNKDGVKVIANLTGTDTNIFSSLKVSGPSAWLQPINESYEAYKGEFNILSIVYAAFIDLKPINV